MFLTTHRLQLPANGGFEPSYGDAGTPENLYTGVPLKLRTVRPANELVVQSGEMTAAVPVRVLDDAQWQLGLEVTSFRVPENGDGVVVQLGPTLRAQGGEEVHGGDGCVFNAFEVGGNTSVRDAVCKAGVWIHEKPWKACAQIRSNVGCLLIQPDGGSSPTTPDGGP
jgi:hypothetical protein